MNRFSGLCLALATLSLGACSHYSDDLAALDGAMKSQPTAVAYNTTAVSPQDIAPAAGGPATGSAGGSISAFLAKDYYDLARYENDKAYDYKAAKVFTKKAMMAQKGTPAAPSKISSYDIPKNLLPELTQARSSLVTALGENSLPENGPALAKAQSSFDCWLERAEEAEDETHYTECKNQFEQSMAMLVMPAAGDTTMTAAPQDGTAVTPAGVASSLQQPQQGAAAPATAAPLTSPATPSYYVPPAAPAQQASPAPVFKTQQ